MNTTDAILTRRSIRQYKSIPIPDELFEPILKAAMYAPSAMNLQPWEFIVLNKKEAMEQCRLSVKHADSILSQAPAAILICGNIEIEKNVDFLVQNCSAATQNILLQIHETGLEGCWIGVYPIQDVMEKLRRVFRLPENILPVSLISLGYPAEEKSFEERYNKEKFHFNFWNKQE